MYGFDDVHMKIYILFAFISQISRSWIIPQNHMTWRYRKTLKRCHFTYECPSSNFNLTCDGITFDKLGI